MERGFANDLTQDDISSLKKIIDNVFENYAVQMAKYSYGDICERICQHVEQKLKWSDPSMYMVYLSSRIREVMHTGKEKTENVEHVGVKSTSAGLMEEFAKDLTQDQILSIKKVIDNLFENFEQEMVMHTYGAIYERIYHKLYI